MISPFYSATELLCESLRRRARALDEPLRERAEEIRLRIGGVPKVGADGREFPFDGGPAVGREELLRTVELCTHASLYAKAGELAEGFLSAPGGHRVGICGRAVLSEGRLSGLTEFSSVCIRIARPYPAAEGLPEQIISGGLVQSTLFLSPPGYGKTTLLRDTARRLSGMGYRMGIADERGEICAATNGVPGFDMGPCADILSGAPKAEAIYRLCRCMAPHAIAVDEITAPCDGEAVLSCVGMGVAVLATAHGKTPEDLFRRPLYRRMAEAGAFERLVLIGAHHRFSVHPFPGL